MDTDAGPLDLLNGVPGAVGYHHMRSGPREAIAGGVTVWVGGYEDLVRMKEDSGREQDLLDIHQLRDSQSGQNTSVFEAHEVSIRQSSRRSDPPLGHSAAVSVRRCESSPR